MRSCRSGHQQDHLEQQIEIGLLLGGDVHHDGVAAPLFRLQAAVGELLLDALGLRVRFIDLVHRDDDGRAGGPGVVDGFEGLRHDAVVGGDHQDHDVGDLGAARPHARERFVTGRVDEDDLAPVLLDVIGADVLRDAARFLLGDVGQANGVEQRRLAVIDVAHDGDHRRALDAVGFDLGLLHVLHRFLLEADGVDRGAEIPRQLVGELGIERLVDGREDIAVDQLLDHHAGFDVQLLGKLLDRDAFGDGDLARDGRRRGGTLPARGTAQHFLFALRRAVAALRARAALIRRTALLDSDGRRLASQRRARRRMHRPRSHRPARRRSGAHAWAADHGGPGANRRFVNRLSGNRRLLPQRNAGARRRRLTRRGDFRLQASHHVRPRRNHGTLRRLADQTGTRRRPKSRRLTGRSGWP